MKLSFITKQNGEVVSPISLRFDSGIDLKLRFDTPWPNATSPIKLSFTGGIDPEPPIVNSITRQFSAVWVSPLVTESHQRLSNKSTQLEASKGLNWLSERAKQHCFSFAWDIPPVHMIAVASVWSGTLAHLKRFSTTWGGIKIQERVTAIAYSQGLVYVVRQAFSWLDFAALSSQFIPVWETLDKPQAQHELSFNTSAVIDVSHYLTWGPHKSSWQCSDDYRLPVGKVSMRFSKPWTDSSSPIALCFVKSPMVCEYDDGGGLINANPSLPPIDFEVPIEPQLRRAYIMQPTIDCIRVSDSKRIVINSVSLNHSRGQFSQSVSIGFSSRIDAENAENQLLKLSLNGYDFYFICEEKAESKLFGSHTFTANGRSRSAELATPYELPVSYTNGTGRSFAGILSDLIQFSPWSVSLAGLADFTVPAGAYSTSGASPLEAINDAAEQVGCMVLSDDDTQTLTVVPRWPTVPWLMSGANPDITVHEAVILSHSMRETRQVLCNSVWIRGEQQGVSCQVKRAGTLGNVNASDISAQLIVDNQAARIAGTVALADTGKKRIHNIALPIMADIPPLTVGMLVGVRDGATLFKSVCDSVNISVNVSEQGEVSIEQAITVIESLE
ncbi:hypothetical protein [Shewanella psychropiezotolerans]|uniref:hypothetical protein n=1 Tax=Shewanella psychropiezotolerans TaxID=2593655 RepID=UPI001E4FA8A4|nr:hypothetical protein [Shewanella psychropiezotolerans]